MANLQDCLELLEMLQKEVCDSIQASSDVSGLYGRGWSSEKTHKGALTERLPAASDSGAAKVNIFVLIQLAILSSTPSARVTTSS